MSTGMVRRVGALLLVLVFASIAAAWLLLVRVSRRPGWGYVGEPLHPMEIRRRIAMAKLRRAVEQMKATLIPAFQALAEGMALAAVPVRTLGEAFARAGELTRKPR